MTSNVRLFSAYANNNVDRWKEAIGFAIQHNSGQWGTIVNVDRECLHIKFVTHAHPGRYYFETKHLTKFFQDIKIPETKTLETLIKNLELTNIFQDMKLLKRLNSFLEHPEIIIIEFLYDKKFSKNLELFIKNSENRALLKFIIKEFFRRQQECQEAERQERERLRLEAEREKLRLEAERQKREQLRLEAEKQEAERKRIIKQTLLKDLRECFEQKFLETYNFYQNRCAEYISPQEYQTEKLNYVRSWIQQHLNSEPDFEQVEAIAAVEDHVQVVARAGSGKTSTLVNRALFLQQHCHVAPGEMLLLAFNRRAAEEIQERLAAHLSNVPHVMTFHALAYALVHPEENLIFDEPDGEQSQSRAMQSILDDCRHNPNYHEKIRILMMMHFQDDWERIVSGGYDESPEEMLRYRRSLPREGMDGRNYKSFGEKVIANFLFEHNIDYKYERNFWWNGNSYRPDFTIFTGENRGIVIEYFGLTGDPDYDAMSEQKRQYWENKLDWSLLEFSPKLLRQKRVEEFCDELKQSLEGCGIRCDRLSEAEIWRKIKDRAIDRFTKTVKGFIKRCRQLFLTPEKLAEMVARHTCFSDAEKRFLELAETFYQSYLERLQATGEEDFEGLMQKSVRVVKLGNTIFKRRAGIGDLRCLRYVLIDEYQDFSELFHRLIEAVREQNPQACFFCVGDDWQAINGFAGSDLRFYQNFEEFFQPSHQLKITTNYRSATSIVDIGNLLMQGLGTPARACKRERGIVEIADLGTFEPTPRELEEHSGDNLTSAVLRLVNKTIEDGRNVVLLSRKNSLSRYGNYTRRQDTSGELDRFLSSVRSHLPEGLKDRVTISTVHKYKGLQEDVVIILDAVPFCYPLLHPDMIFSRIFGDSVDKVIEDERRLFYVALTRAVEGLYIITENDNISPFLEEIWGNETIPSLNWSDYPPSFKIRHITIRVGNQVGRDSSPTCTIKDLLKAEGYRWNRNGWQAWCLTLPAEGFSIQQFFAEATWIDRADGIEVRFDDASENTIAIYRVNEGQLTCID